MDNYLSRLILLAFTLLISVFFGSDYTAANSLKQNRKVFDFLVKRIEAFEFKFGPAIKERKTADGISRTYEIGDCTFYIDLFIPDGDIRGAIVSAVGMEIKPKICDVMTSPEIGLKKTVANSRPHDFFDRGYEEWFSIDCLTFAECGNSAESTIKFYSQLPHANQYMQAQIEVTMPSGVSDLLWKSESRQDLESGHYDLKPYTAAFKKIIANETIRHYVETYGQ